MESSWCPRWTQACSSFDRRSRVGITSVIAQSLHEAIEGLDHVVELVQLAPKL